MQLSPVLIFGVIVQQLRRSKHGRGYRHRVVLASDIGEEDGLMVRGERLFDGFVLARQQIDAKLVSESDEVAPGMTLRERLERELRKDQTVESLVEELMEIGRHCASLPLLDGRTPDEILGYDESGVPQ